MLTTYEVVEQAGTWIPLDKHCMKRILILLLVLVFPIVSSGQSGISPSLLQFNMDFRFRIEEDWNSKKSDGTFRNNRTRFRYRLRFGVQYSGNWYHTGFRLRTGDQRKQQDPQLTLGKGFEEFGTLPIGLEKAYFHGFWHSFSFWVGKNTYPFEKNNELFWSDNVYPEGVTLRKGFSLISEVLDSIDVRAGHFVISSLGTSLGKDAYFQGYQLYMTSPDNLIQLFPALYLFRNLPNIPDGGGSFTLDYTIIHIATKLKVIRNSSFQMELDYYNNINDYSQNELISSTLRNQSEAYVIGFSYGELKKKGNWFLKVTYANLQQFSAVDFLAQNDWVRWDYSSFNSPDGRLTNYEGVEFVLGYAINNKANLVMKAYRVNQLIPYGIEKETGSRVRFDIDVKF